MATVLRNLGVTKLEIKIKVIMEKAGMEHSLKTAMKFQKVFLFT